MFKSTNMNCRTDLLAKIFKTRTRIEYKKHRSGHFENVITKEKA